MQNQQSRKKKNIAPRGDQMTKQEKSFFLSDAKGKPVVLRRKLTFTAPFSQTTGSAFSQAQTTGGVTAATEWANLSANYEQYRVRALKMTVVPRVFSNMNSAAQVWYPGMVVVGKYPIGSGGATVLAILAEDGSEFYAGWEKFSKIATWESNPDAKLWTNCNASIPSLSLFGVQFQGTMVVPATYNTIATHDIVLEYDVEFRGRN